MIVGRYKLIPIIFDVAKKQFVLAKNTNKYCVILTNMDIIGLLKENIFAFEPIRKSLCCLKVFYADKNY